MNSHNLCLKERETLELTYVVEDGIMDMRPISHYSYQRLLEIFPTSASTGLLKAVSIAMAKKLEKFADCQANCQEIICIRHIFSSSYSPMKQMLEKDDMLRLDALGFWLLTEDHSLTTIDDKNHFCKESHFWPGYIR